MLSASVDTVVDQGLLCCTGANRTDGLSPEMACSLDWRVLGSSKETKNIETVRLFVKCGQPV